MRCLRDNLDISLVCCTQLWDIKLIGALTALFCVCVCVCRVEIGQWNRIPGIGHLHQPIMLSALSFIHQSHNLSWYHNNNHYQFGDFSKWMNLVEDYNVFLSILGIKSSFKKRNAFVFSKIVMVMRSSDFVNHSYDYRPNCTPLRPLTITNYIS